MIESRRLKMGAAAMALAANQYVSKGSALELANSVATALMDEVGEPYDCALTAIQQRIKHKWMKCRQPRACALAMQKAWNETVNKKDQ
jgi:hypothetical protein